MLTINITGAGIAGLAAAIALRRAGHKVHVYERSSMNNEVGAAISLTPNSVRILSAWGLDDPVGVGFVKLRKYTRNNPSSLEVKMVVTDETTAVELGGTDYYLAHRVDLHNALKSIATRDDGPGIPAVIHTNAEVIAYDSVAPSITLASGEVAPADVIIGADGVHSRAVETVTGLKNQPVSAKSVNVAFRFLISSETLGKDDETKFWNDDSEGWLRIFPDNAKMRSVVCYPCRDNTIYNFAALLYDEDSKYEKKEDWLASVDISHVLEKYSDYSPKLLRVISKATEVKRWPLLYRAPIPAWSKGRMTLAGDAAHPMLPYQGQGAGMGLEDGMALGIILHGCSSSSDEIERRLCIYEDIRRNRASAMQTLSSISPEKSHLLGEDLREYLPPDQIPQTPTDVLRYCYGYDIIRESVRAMREYDSAFSPPDVFAAETF